MAEEATAAPEQQQYVAPPPPPLRWSWEQFPNSRIDATRMVVPLGCLYTPLGQAVAELPYEPLSCSCGGILNNACTVDFRSKSWQCPFCLNRNGFPPHYATMTEHHLPAELMQEYSVVEYIKPAVQTRPSATMIFVIDTCVDTEEEVADLKSNVQRAISQLPEHVNVALITFGATVMLHDLSGATEYPRSLVFRGSNEVTPAVMKALLKHPERYVMSLGQAEFVLSTIIEELQVDFWPIAKDHRAMRCTGAAISAGASILEVVAPKTGGGVMAFLSGACTEGPGQIVELPRAQMIRTHNAIKDRDAKLHDAACTFYDSLMRRMVAQGHALHVVSACLDQVGIAEMRAAVQCTGGTLIASDLWKRAQLKASIDRLFERRHDNSLAMGLNATIEVLTSPSWKVMGAIGQCIGTGKRSNSVAETEVGLGGTCQWTTCYLDTRSTIGFYFEPAALPANSPASKSMRFVQFVTRYQQGNSDRIRVLTVKHPSIEAVNYNEIGNSFDQEAAAVLLARIAVHKTETTQVFDIMRWLDKHTIRLVSKFGDYVKEQPNTLRLSPRFSNFPLFLYHLRRSAYLQVFNNSPDETAVLRVLLLKSTAADSILMIHPTLHSYTLQQPVRPVPLDISSCTPDNVLLLDTFFEVLIHHGETIKAWREQGFEENPDYAYFKQFLDVPRADAQALAANRFPAPRLLECGQGDGDGRILYNRINPSRTHKDNQGGYGVNPGELVYTDDTSLQVFMDHLKKLAVQPQS